MKRFISDVILIYNIQHNNSTKVNYMKYDNRIDFKKLESLTSKEIKDCLRIRDAESKKLLKYLTNMYGWKAGFGKYYQSSLWKWCRFYIIKYFQKTKQLQYLGNGKYICPKCNKPVTQKQLSPHHLNYKLKGFFNNPTHHTFSLMCVDCHQEEHGW